MISLFKKKPPVEVDFPSITKQTPWPCKVFHFGKAEKKGTDYFNCSICRRSDGLWLVTRRAIWDRRDRLGFNDIVAFQLDEQLNPIKMMPVLLGKRWHIEHFEDPRVMIHEGRTFILCCNFVRNNKGCTFPHQIVCEVDWNWKGISRHDPVYGNNGADIPEQKKHEKNWGYFQHKDSWYLLYDGCPLTIVPCPVDFQPDSAMTSKFLWDETGYWNFGHIRGGSQPVFFDGLYWTFFHSSVNWKHGKRRYHVGAYAFEPFEPYRMVRITPSPLLSGSDKDPWAMGKPACVFPGSAIIEDGRWLMVGGLNDLRCYWIRIPHDELIQKMVAVEA